VRETVTVDQLYSNYDVEHDEFAAALDESLDPRDRDLLFDLVADLDLAAGSLAVDVGCRRAHYAIELARRFGLRVHGVDPMRNHIDDTRQAIADSDVAGLVSVELGAGESLSPTDDSVSLVWCRDVLVHVADLDAVFAEFRRVLRPDGHAVVFQMMATDWLEPQEAQRLWAGLAVVPENTDQRRFESAIRAAGLSIETNINLSSEWREASEEDYSRPTSVELLRLARLLRGREKFVARFGQTEYDITVSHCLWGVYQMIGKLSPRVYVLGRQS
jgi:ubiquinone/menaquinone biosynthesis C-methylase UbiE